MLIVSAHSSDLPDLGPRTLDLGPWTLDLGPWTLDLGPWTLDLGPWTLDLGPWTLFSVAKFGVKIKHVIRVLPVHFDFHGGRDAGSIVRFEREELAIGARRAVPATGDSFAAG